MRYSSCLMLCVCLPVALVWSQTWSESARAQGKDSKPRLVEVVDCTIKLLDEVVLAADRPGVIGFVKPRDGDLVTEGLEVAGLQDDVARAALAVAEKEAESDVDIRYAQKAGEVSKAEHEKALEANRIQEKTIPDIEVKRLKLAEERSLLELESARLKREVAELKRDQALAELRTYQVKAPFSGVVTRVHRSKGEAVRQGDPVLEMVSTERVRIDGLVPIRDIWQVRPGCEVIARLEIPDVDLEVEKREFKGKVVFVDVKAEPVTQSVRIWAEVENPENLLRAGLKARLTIDVSRPTAPASRN